jgi:hypothetical protein
MSDPILATCDRCGDQVELHPPNLLASGGFMAARDDPVEGWQVLSYTCGPCHEKRPRTWACAHCGGTGPIDGNFCSTCHHVRPDPLPYTPDPNLLAKEERERTREAEAILHEAIEEFGSAAVFGSGRKRDRL